MIFAEILTTLCFGGCICVLSEDERLNDLTGAINRLGVNTALITPSVLRLMDPEQVPNLRMVVSAGEPLSDADLDRWAERIILINAYGPAECSVYATI